MLAPVRLIRHIRGGGGGLGAAGRGLPPAASTPYVTEDVLSRANSRRSTLWRGLTDYDM
ncbi:hypothetical protein J6590_051260 [Homalodisca vitripennis]|nr:hypothetical protein J6590_051260 [Homalodisca vitripennis]